jgi:hypothetical protein
VARHDHPNRKAPSHRAFGTGAGTSRKRSHSHGVARCRSPSVVYAFVERCSFVVEATPEPPQSKGVRRRGICFSAKAMRTWREYVESG